LIRKQIPIRFMPANAGHGHVGYALVKVAFRNPLGTKHGISFAKIRGGA